MEGPDSSYSCLVIHIWWKVEREAKMDPPIQTEYFLSGGAMIFTFIVGGARADISFCIRSAIPAYMVVPPIYKCKNVTGSFDLCWWLKDLKTGNSSKSVAQTKQKFRTFSFRILTFRTKKWNHFILFSTTAPILSIKYLSNFWSRLFYASPYSFGSQVYVDIYLRERCSRRDRFWCQYRTSWWSCKWFHVPHTIPYQWKPVGTKFRGHGNARYRSWWSDRPEARTISQDWSCKKKLRCFGLWYTFFLQAESPLVGLNSPGSLLLIRFRRNFDCTRSAFFKLSKLSETPGWDMKYWIGPSEIHTLRIVHLLAAVCISCSKSSAT